METCVQRNLVSPMRSRHQSGYRTARLGTAQGVEEAGESERPPAMGGTAVQDLPHIERWQTSRMVRRWQEGGGLVNGSDLITEGTASATDAAPEPYSNWDSVPWDKVEATHHMEAANVS